METFSKDVAPRELEEVLRLEYRSKLLNPKWAQARCPARPLDSWGMSCCVKLAAPAETSLRVGTKLLICRVSKVAMTACLLKGDLPFRIAHVDSLCCIC